MPSNLFVHYVSSLEHQKFRNGVHMVICEHINLHVHTYIVMTEVSLCEIYKHTDVYEKDFINEVSQCCAYGYVNILTNKIRYTCIYKYMYVNT